VCVCCCTVRLLDSSLVPYEPINRIELNSLKGRVSVNAVEGDG